MNDEAVPLTPISINATDAKKREVNPDIIWRSGCLVMNKGMVKYITGYIIAVFVVGFCSYQLTQHHACEYQTLYSGLISLIIGAFLRGALA